jgi:hypothetical protein
VLVASAIIGSMLLLLSIFRWTRVEWLTPFIEPLLELVVSAVFLGVTIWALVHFIRRRRSLGTIRSVTPLAIDLLVLAIVIFVPFTKITIMLDFRWHLAKRTEVVDAVIDGKMNVARSGGRGDLIHLPPKFQDLSAGGGDIMVTKKNGQVSIFFFSYRGILDSFSGFVYSTDNAKPEKGDFGGNFVEVEQLRPNWYWAASRN